ncbi:MAG TPA: YiaA/YiaB family inner membrane protein [Burkholderiaceae bacterium]|nr:YiaA/YiaB family inner membrane protein [Burkholderiaceae bacterium]
MSTRYVMRVDTPAWRIQVWASFAIALAASAWGMLEAPSAELDRAFLAIGLLFSLFACFAVAKTTRDNRDGQVDTQGWVITVWMAFAGALALTAWGLWRMKIDPWQKAFLLISWLFLLSATFTLAKTIRDKHEAALMAREARADRDPDSRRAA